MAGLVAPVYILSPNQERILEFKGYNKRSVIDDGEMRDMSNLSSDEYPCLYQRKPRGICETGIPNMGKPTAIAVKNQKLAIIADGKFYYDGALYPSLKLSDKTQMVAINTRICFFPEKKWFNVKTGTFGDLDAKVEAKDVTVSVSSTSIMFSESMGFAEKFAAGDAIQLETSNVDLNISAAIESVSDREITFPSDTFISVIAEGETELSVKLSSFKAERSCPDLDFVMESNNRLWGVSNKDNTIYACKLGDPTNWAYFQNTTLDSYYAEQGTDGEWTGCAAYSTHLLFFKEDYIHKVYGSKPSAYSIETAKCHALEKGSHKSVAIINETVLYKSRLGIMAYSGGTPVLISENFGTDKLYDAVAGTDGIKYYVSVLRDGLPELLVYDMERFLWHKEDSVRVREFVYHNGKLVFINDADNVIYEIDSDTPMKGEEDILWMAELGPFDEFIEDKKVYSKLKMRLNLEKGSELAIFISIDGGDWERLEYVVYEHEGARDIPVVPRRCNKFSVRLEGKGYCKIESLVRVYRHGSSRKDVK